MRLPSSADDEGVALEHKKAPTFTEEKFPRNFVEYEESGQTTRNEYGSCKSTLSYPGSTISSNRKLERGQLHLLQRTFGLRWTGLSSKWRGGRPQLPPRDVESVSFYIRSIVLEIVMTKVAW